MEYALTLAALAMLFDASAQTMIKNDKLTCSTWPKVRTEVPAKLYVQGLLNGMSLVYWSEREAKVGTPKIDPLSELKSLDHAYSMIDVKCAEEPQIPLDVAVVGVFYQLQAKQLVKNAK